MTSHEVAPSPWRSNTFRWFATGNCINNLGEGIYDIALPLLVYSMTGSVVALGIVAALTPATLLLGPLLGAWADQKGSGSLVTSGLWVQLFAAVTLSALVSYGNLETVVLVLLASVLQVAGACYRVGWMTGVPAMFPENAVRARGTLSSLFIATTIAGPLLVGLLLPLLGYSVLLWLNCLTFLAPLAVSYSGLRPPDRAPSKFSVSHVLSGLKVGANVLRTDKTLLRLTLALLPFDFVMSAAIPTLALFYLRDSFDLAAGVVATTFAFFNVFALIGALLVSERRTFNAVKVVGIITVGLAGALSAASIPVLVVVLAALTVLMLLDGAGASAQSMMVVQLVPDEVFGRASGVIRLVHGVPAVLGPVFVAAAVPLVGANAVFVILAAIALISAIALTASNRQTAESQSPSGVSK